MKSTPIDPALLKEDVVRQSHLKNILAAHLEAYPSHTERSHTLAQARNVPANTLVSVVGRIMSRRTMGKLTFCHLKDASGRLQIALTEKILDIESYNFFTKNVDVADFIAVTGKLFVTHKGEVSINVEKYTMLAKALLPLPEKFHGLTDVEARFRKRYLDLIMNEGVYERMVTRSKIISELRSFLDARDFLEIETPTLQPIYGGGLARPFKTHHKALDADFYLRISDEMYLKRCIVGGFEKVYEITKVFRNEGIDHDHNPEFTLFEAQIAYQDYHFGMDLIEELVEHMAQTVLGTTEIKHGNVIVNVKRPWKRLRLVEAVKTIGGIDVTTWSTLAKAKQELLTYLPEKKKAELDRLQSIGEVIALAFEELIEAKLIQPTIIYDYPREVSPLAKKCANPRFTQRFEAFALGSEISNNYSELNDPVDLEQRFIDEKKKQAAGFDEAHQTDHDYLEAIKHGLPPTCGISLGLDRVIMLLTGVANIKEVILFPTLRPEHPIAPTPLPVKTKKGKAK